jgi:hypothetical protein
LIDRGLLSEGDLIRALEEQETTRISVGRLAFEQGELELDDIVAILERQREGSKMRFCALAVQMGLLEDHKRKRLLELHEESKPPLGQILISMGLLAPEIVAEELDAYEDMD